MGQSTVEQTQPAVSAGDLSSGAELTPSIFPTWCADDGVPVPVSPETNEDSSPLVTNAYEIQEKDSMVEPTTMSRELVIYQGRKRPAETQDSINGCEWERVQRRRLEYGNDGLGLKRVKSGPFHKRRSKLDHPLQRNKQQKRTWASFRLLVAERERMIKQKAKEKKIPKEETRGEETKSACKGNPREESKIGESENGRETTETETEEKGLEDNKSKESESAESKSTESESTESESMESDTEESEKEIESDESTESEGSSEEEWGGIQGNKGLRRNIRPRGGGRAQTGGSDSTTDEKSSDIDITLKDDNATASFESDESVSVESAGLYKK